MPMKREARDGIRSRNLDAIFYQMWKRPLIQTKIYPIWDRKMVGGKGILCFEDNVWMMG
jgi:hypothetical protein